MASSGVTLHLMLLVAAVLLSSLAGLEGRKIWEEKPWNRVGGILTELEKEIGVSTVRSFCIPRTSQYLHKQEGAHSCVYNSSGGFRAVGVGYNLDDDKEQAKLELGTLGLDYTKVYEGSQCLNQLQINTLLLLTSKRALDRAAERASALDEWCCDVQKVYADVALTTWDSSKAWTDLTDFLEKTSTHNWKEAARALERSDWCHDFAKRCKEAVQTIKAGCGDGMMPALKEVV